MGPSHPRPHPEVLVDRRSTDLEGGLQKPLRSLEPSFEAHFCSHLRMRLAGRMVPSAQIFGKILLKQALRMRSRVRKAWNRTRNWSETARRISGTSPFPLRHRRGPRRRQNRFVLDWRPLIFRTARPPCLPYPPGQRSGLRGKPCRTRSRIGTSPRCPRCTSASPPRLRITGNSPLPAFRDRDRILARLRGVRIAFPSRLLPPGRTSRTVRHGANPPFFRPRAPPSIHTAALNPLVRCRGSGESRS